jgi:hypothetical protein
MDWRKGLTEKEKRHLRETGATTKDAFIRNRKGQAENNLPCFECRSIAKKLRIEE